MNTSKGRQSVTVGVIGHQGSGKTSLCRVLSDDLFTWKGMVQTPITERFCVSDTHRIHLIDIDVTKKPRKYAVSSLSECDAIIYIVSAAAVDTESGIADEDTARMMRRYLQIGHVFGVKHFIIAINKMDNPPVAYSEYVFNGMMERVQEIMNKTNIDHYCILPLSTLNGDNIGMKSVNYYNDKMEWFDGLTLKEIIANIKPQRNEGGTPLLSITSTNCRNDVVFGKMIIGMFNVGDHIIIFPSGKKAKIQSIERDFERVNEVICGDAVGLKLSVNYRLHRGDVILLDDHIYGEATIRFAQKLSAMIHIQRWSHKEQIKDTILCIGSAFTILIRNQKTEYRHQIGQLL